MRIKSYILAADPAWIEASVLSYYDLVSEIVVSYDENSRGWTGGTIEVGRCLDRLRAIDHRGKMRFCPGHFARIDHHPMENETYQRQYALEIASEGADWVIQLDTDEVLADSKEFLSCLQQAHQGFDGMDYPARWLYRQLGNGRFLEWATRTWQISASYPGPVAVRAYTKLHHARQCEANLFRVDFRLQSTSLAHPKNIVVHRAVHFSQAVYHYSWVREEKELKRKFAVWGHARDRNWSPELKRWLWCGRHPHLAVLLSALARGNFKRHLRIVRIPAPSEYLKIDKATFPDLAYV